MTGPRFTAELQQLSCKQMGQDMNSPTQGILSDISEFSPPDQIVVAALCLVDLAKAVDEDHEFRFGTIIEFDRHLRAMRESLVRWAGSVTEDNARDFLKAIIEANQFAGIHFRSEDDDRNILLLHWRMMVAVSELSGIDFREERQHLSVAPSDTSPFDTDTREPQSADMPDRNTAIVSAARILDDLVGVHGSVRVERGQILILHQDNGTGQHRTRIRANAEFEVFEAVWFGDPSMNCLNIHLGEGPLVDVVGLVLKKVVFHEDQNCLSPEQTLALQALEPVILRKSE